MPERYPLSDPRAHQNLVFTFTPSSSALQGIFVQIIPITGSIDDLYSDSSYDPFGTLPPLSALLSAGGFFNTVAKFSVTVRSDRIVEGDETFKIAVYSGPASPALGYPPLVEAIFTIADDDEPGFAQHLIGTDEVDRMQGAAKSDILKGYGGNDTLTGLGGNDRLNGGTGDDMMYGGAGNDTYIVDSKGDRVFETATAKSAADTGGVDTVQSSVTYSIADTIRGRQFIEKLTLTGTANISGTGNSLANVLVGNDGNNVLRGFAGNDTIKAGTGADKLYGGDGGDTLTGGAGRDAFIFDTAPNSRDLITDFSHSKGDMLLLSKATFTGFSYTGTLNSDAFLAAAGATEANDASDRVIYDTATGILYYDADGVGGTAAVEFAQLGGVQHPALVYSDLQIIA